MRALQAILGAILLALTVACLDVTKNSERVNHKASDTSTVESGELMKQTDTLNNVVCYHRVNYDPISCVILSRPN